MLSKLDHTREELEIIEAKSEKLREQRQNIAVDLIEQGFTKYRVAKMLDVSQTTVNRWLKDREESQERSNFSTNGDQSGTN